MSEHAQSPLIRAVNESGGALQTDVRKLTRLLDIKLARRPWRRRRLTDKELLELSRALVSSGCALADRRTIPGTLNAVVTVRLLRESAKPPYGPLWHYAHRIGKLAFGGITLAASVSALVLLAFPPSSSLAPLNGLFNVGVLPLRAVGADARTAQPVATALGTNLAADLSRELGEIDPDAHIKVSMLPRDAIDVRHLQDNDRIANIFAKRIHADVLIFGDVSDTGPKPQLTAYVYLGRQKLRSASELVGSSPLGDPIPVPFALGDSAPAEGELLRTVAARMSGLAEFVDAVQYYTVRQFGQALRHLRAADGTVGWTSGVARALVNVFLGNATAFGGYDTPARLRRALSFYQRAVIMDKAFGRGPLGVAEMRFQLSRGACTRATVDAHELQTALKLYHDVLAQASRAEPPSDRFDLVAKAHFGIGRIYLCESQAEVANRWEAATAELRVMTSAYLTDPALQNDSAEAWADLAITQLPLVGNIRNTAAYSAAKSSYSRAIALQTDPTAVPALYRNRAFVEMRLGQTAAAEHDYSTAAALAGGTHA